MESLTSGTFVGSGSFRCTNCDYTLTLSGTDTLTDCPSCGGKEFVRASLFSNTERMQHHCSTVNAAEQREALAKVIRLFALPPPASGGEYGGEDALPGGEDKKKAG